MPWAIDAVVPYPHEIDEIIEALRGSEHAHEARYQPSRAECRAAVPVAVPPPPPPQPPPPPPKPPEWSPTFAFLERINAGQATEEEHDAWRNWLIKRRILSVRR